MSTAARPDLFPNPLGIAGFDFVEFASPDPTALHNLFVQMGFSAVAKHKTRAITLMRQRAINFLINEEPNSFASRFAAEHGPCACGFAIRVTDAAKTVDFALGNGATALERERDSLGIDARAISGIGGAALYLIDRVEDDAASIYATQFDFFADSEAAPVGFGLTFIDHLTHNVFHGNMGQWADYYERIFGFREIRYFDIKGAKTGLVSKALTAPDGMVRIPLNESSDPKSQINEYLDEYHGEGIQHIALFSDDIYASVEAMRAAGMQFLNTPDTYFDVIDQRMPNHSEDVPRLAKNKILIDADLETKKKILLQIFTQNMIGPIFFEIIQRKGNEGFGEGNFQALFESIERDQMRRGVL